MVLFSYLTHQGEMPIYPGFYLIDSTSDLHIAMRLAI